MFRVFSTHSFLPLSLRLYYSPPTPISAYASPRRGRRRRRVVPRRARHALHEPSVAFRIAKTKLRQNRKNEIELRRRADDACMTCSTSTKGIERSEIRHHATRNHSSVTQRLHAKNRNQRNAIVVQIELFLHFSFTSIFCSL